MTDILQAARSYYGMDSTPVGKCEMYTNEHGSMRLVIEIPVTGSDFIAIGERMKAMQEAESQHIEQAPIFGEDVDTHAMRQRYNALSKAERGFYGSFGRYLEDQRQKQANEDMLAAGAGDSKVAHVDPPETEDPTSMDAVWLPIEDLTMLQNQFYMKYDPDKGYLIHPDLLTEEQRQKAKEKP